MNNLTEAVIVITEAEQQEFARRFRENMPKTFSGAIFQAADALEKFAKRDDAKVNMRVWHRVRLSKEKEPVCVACLAGSAVIDLCGATGFEIAGDWSKKYDFGLFSGERINLYISNYMSIINNLRHGSFRWSFRIFYENFVEGDALDGGNYPYESLDRIGNRFFKAGNRRGKSSPEYIGLLRRAAEEVKALGL